VVVESGARIAAGVQLGAFCYVGAGCVVGEDTVAHPRVTLYREVSVGRRCILHSGVVLGADGFGFLRVEGRHVKVPHVGTVSIADDVEIGAGSAVDRATVGVTRVGARTKIDNLVQIAHNVSIGKHCILCAQVGIAGSTTVQDYVVLGGQSAAAGHLTIGKGAKVGGQAGINGDIAPNTFVNGTPAIPYMLERRIAVLQHRLPNLFKRVDALEEQLKKSSS